MREFIIFSCLVIFLYFLNNVSLFLLDVKIVKILVFSGILSLFKMLIYFVLYL